MGSSGIVILFCDNFDSCNSKFIVIQNYIQIFTMFLRARGYSEVTFSLDFIIKPPSSICPHLLLLLASESVGHVTPSNYLSIYLF